jgi:signal-transduction protein with cAMP-binding, CBS, and nucleotidyltransferase domain
MDRLEVLRRSELFTGLSDEQLNVVEKMCTSDVFEPGAIICKQDRKEERLYVIEEGLVGIFLEVGPLSQRQIQAASNFETVCWSAMIEPYVCTATAKAMEKTKVLAFVGSELCDLCLSKPDIGCSVCRAVARIVAGRLRHAFTQCLGVTYQE